ncbi:acyltransferase [Novosphingobium sp. MD-1]|uniref:acyltransferase n=1 Tax=Novosphingobium sp. MD-1 TaxID=1630648 RepID=UPI00061CC31D|nr:acyltransferase [Novosphingobium sp. MD-1]GAO55320.1 acetyltransferase homolog [Novosphingobium sp. MD-1]
MFKRSWQRFVQTRVWGMDIHPSARIAPTALIDRTWPKGVHIEADVVIDEEAVLLTHDVTRGLFTDTRICEGAVLGPRAIVLPGITVGKGSTVMAGALVNRDVPDGVTVIGNPARVVEDGAGE